MAITTRDNVIAGLAQAVPWVLDKATIATQVIGLPCSLWRATGTPAQAAIPGAAAVCNAALLGAFPLVNQTLPAKNYLGRLSVLNSLANSNLILADRLVHMGGLSGTVATLQTVGLDLLTQSVPVARIGAMDYSSVQWFLEWFTATGGTAVTATVAVTYNDGTTGNLAAISLPATVSAGRMIPLIPAVAGKYIRGVTGVTLSATTGTAGSFGVCATRALTCLLYTSPSPRD